MKILLVDDEIVALNALKKRVDWVKYGFVEVFTARDGEQARSILKQEKIDLVLCDIEMPGESGLDLVEYIKDTYPQTDCIMVTCHADFGYVKKSMRVKAFDYILKPIDYEELGMVLNKFVEEKNAAQKQQKLGEIVEKTEQTRGGDLDNPAERIQIAEKYIEEHIQQKIYVEELAELVHVNEQYFMRIFKKETGKSVTERKVMLASDLLKNTDKSINFIADCVGCENYSYFTKIFKKYTGVTPREYRMQFGK